MNAASSPQSSVWSRSAQLAGIVLVCAALLLLTLNSIGDYSRRPVATTALDVNLVARAGLLQIPGIGPSLAKNIVANRPYRTLGGT